TTNGHTRSLHDALPISDHQHGMAVAVALADNRHQQRAGFPAGLDELAALGEGDILAIAVARRVGPEFVDLVEIRVGHRHDVAVRSEEHTSELQSRENLV